MLDAAALAQKVSGQADPVSVYVWGQSSTAAQQTMSSASASDHELQSALVETLNTLLVDNQFFTRERFAHVRLSPEVRQMTVQAPGLGDELARFNRLLLEDAYSWLRKTQPSVPERPAPCGVRTAQGDYPPGATAPINGWGFEAGETVELQVLHNDGTPNTGMGHTPWPVTVNDDGTFLSSWFVCEDDCLDSTLLLRATGQSSGIVEEYIFTDALEARVFERLISFAPQTDVSIGQNPWAGVVVADDGNLYGVTQSGGANGGGTVYKVSPDGSGFSTLHNFDYSNGYYPQGELIQGDDGAIYGTTLYGGSSGNGTVFKINMDGSGYTELHSFNYSDGYYVYAGVTQGDDGTLYGTTYYGGSSGHGTAYKLNPDGTGFTVLHNFLYSTDGGYIQGGLMQASDGALYGTAAGGGSSGYGTIYKVNTDGTGFTVLRNMDYSQGGSPYGLLTQAADGLLYGTTYSGGSSGYGTVYKIETNGTGYTQLQGFDYYSGGYPRSGVIQGADGAIYGTTSYGGGSGYGTVYKVNTDGTGFTVLKALNYSEGYYIYATVAQGPNGVLYSTANSGGAHGYGSLFKLNPDGTGFEAIVNFHAAVYDISEGAYPVGELVQADNGALYGTHTSGGVYGAGVLFKVNPDGSNYSVLYDFDYSGGSYPYGALIQADDGLIYGTTNYGGSNGGGTVFRIDTDGTGYAEVKSFSYSEGYYLYGGVSQGSDGALYGATYYGGSGGYGTVFKVNPDGTGFATLHNFSYSDGGYSFGGVIEASNGALYGTTNYGGPSGYGTVFTLQPDGTGFATVHSFTYADGSYPQAGVIEGDDGLLYGTTNYGGTGGGGTVYQVAKDGTGFNTVHEFNYSDGYYLYSGVMQASDGVLYGTTYYGGANGYGTVYGVRTDGTDFTRLVDFNGTNGGYIQTGVIEGLDGGLYGVTQQGGDSQRGTLFRLIGSTPTVADAGVDFSVEEGQVVTLDGSASTGAAGMTFDWTQTAGPSVAISGTNTATPSFQAPSVAIGGETLTFALTVSASGGDATDTVNVTVVNVNHPPVAEAGEDMAIAEGCPVTLNGGDSFDIDNDPFTYTWVQVSGPTVVITGANTATPTFEAPFAGAGGAPGVVATLVFRLTVEDGYPQDAPAPGYAFSDVSDEVTIDITNVNNLPIADAGLDQTLDENAAVTLSGIGSSDPDSDMLTYSWQQVVPAGGQSVLMTDPDTATPSFIAPFVSPGGSDLTFELTVDDGFGGITSDTVVVHVQNANDPPLASAARPTKALLWPPSHGMVQIGIEGVTDPDNNATITITGVTQDEATNGLGDGDTAIDAVINPDGTVMLRAERAGGGNGRVYRVSFTAADYEGSSSGVVYVTVPKSKKSTAVDSGPVIDSTN